MPIDDERLAGEMQTESLRFFLRSRTHEAHLALDGMVGDLDCAARYGDFVRGSYRHRAPIEAGLGSVDWPDAFGAWRPRTLAPLIARDLEDLGLTLPEIEPFVLSNDMGTLVGTAYVLEGSALGARLVAKRAGQLGFDGRHGARHLAGQTADLDNWRAFLALIEGLTACDRTRAAQAANAVFSQATRAMSKDVTAAYAHR